MAYQRFCEDVSPRAYIYQSSNGIHFITSDHKESCFSNADLITAKNLLLALHDHLEANGVTIRHHKKTKQITFGKER